MKRKRTLVFGDAHTYPDDEQSRFLGLGRMARKLKCAEIVDLGDRGRWDSLSFHSRPGSLTDKHKAAFADDLLWVRSSQTLLERGLANHKITRKILLGNHEYRMDRYVEVNPELEGVLDSMTVIPGLPEFEKWEVLPYRGWTEICGGAVLATHIPCNGLNRPYGGVNACRTIAMHSERTVVFGHRHTFEIATAARLESEPVQAVSAPCFMPEGRIEDYAVGGLCNWVYGVLLVEWGHGGPPAFQHIPMEAVREYITKR